VDGRSRRASRRSSSFAQPISFDEERRLDLAIDCAAQDNPLRPWQQWIGACFGRQVPKNVEHSIGVPEQQLLEVPLSDTPDRIVIQRR